MTEGTDASGAVLAGDGVEVAVEAHGPDEAELAAAREELVRGALSDVLGERHRWLRFRLDEEDGGVGIPESPRAFEGTLYDYTNRRVVDVSGSLDDLRSAEVSLSGRRPVPTRAEFEEAVSLLADDPVLGPALRDGSVHPYQPMPPLLDAPLPDGRSERVVAVGLTSGKDDEVPQLPALGGRRHRVVGVDLLSGEVTADAGPQHADGDHDCGTHVDDGCAEAGTSGQAVITVRQGAEELWRMLVVRPAASSGTNGSGVELRHVTYRGRSVLRRAHVPILNVEYQGATPACGPTFRDWLNGEACFQADGRDVAPGFRLCPTRPETIIESGTDTGNFRGVAVHLDGSDLLLTTELRAGWYRYITEWRLRADGSIRPRMGFSAVENFCTCQHHVHHAYWRYDWALDGPDDHRVEELGAGPFTDDDEWGTLLVEDSRRRDEGGGRRWRITDRGSGRGYVIVPGEGDGTADLYGAGDTWYLRFHEGEIDDGQGFSSTRAFTRARIDLFANGEWIDGEDVVSWYAVHWDHAPGLSGASLGPELAPVGIEEPGPGVPRVEVDDATSP